MNEFWLMSFHRLSRELSLNFVILLRYYYHERLGLRTVGTSQRSIDHGSVMLICIYLKKCGGNRKAILHNKHALNVFWKKVMTSWCKEAGLVFLHLEAAMETE